MAELKAFLDKNIDKNLRRILISNARKKEGASKLQVRPVLVKGQMLYQVTRTEGTKEIHKNYEKAELISYLCTEMQENFRQLQLEGAKVRGTVLVSKKRQDEHKNQGTEYSGKEQGRFYSHAFP